MKKSKPIICNQSGVLFSSIVEASRITKCHVNTMSQHMYGRLKTVFGKTYRYATAEEITYASNFPMWSPLDYLVK